MTARRLCPMAPGPLEAYAAHFDGAFRRLAQRRAFRTYLAGLLTPRDRNKTLTALAGAEPIVQAQAPEVQRLQGFLKDGTATAHVARQYLGSVGKIDNGIVAVTSLWADARVYYPLHVEYYPLHVEPYTPAGRLDGGKQDAGFHTKPAIARSLIDRARAAGIPFRAVVADCAYGDNDGLEGALVAERIPHVLARRGRASRCWAPAHEAHSFKEAAEDLPLTAWTEIMRRFRDGHTETWWAAELTLASYGPDRSVRAVVATTDREALPALSTWYLTTNFSRTEAPLAEVVRLYGLRVWVEEGTNA